MPSPVSSTSSSASASRVARRTATRPPEGVNFTALEMRLVAICCTRLPSPHM